MKIQFFESEYGTGITLVPETVEEMSQFARSANNTKMDKPSVRLYFGSSPSLEVWLPKVKKAAQKNSIGK
jgi:hypothetical protein